MRAEKVIYSLLSGDAGVTALVSTRVYPSVLPQDKTLPALTYELVSAVEPGTIDSDLAVVQSRVQITSLATSYGACKDALEAARAAVLYQHGTIASVRVVSIVRDLVGPDQFDPEIEAYMQSLDVIVTHIEE